MAVSNETFTWATLFYLALAVFPGAMIVSLIQGLHRPSGSGWGRIARGLALPLSVGLVLAGGYYLYWCGSDRRCLAWYVTHDPCQVPQTAIAVFGAYAIMGAINYLLAPRIRGWTALIGPVLLVGSYLGIGAVLSSMSGLWQALAGPR